MRLRRGRPRKRCRRAGRRIRELEPKPRSQRSAQIPAICAATPQRRARRAGRASCFVGSAGRAAARRRRRGQRAVKGNSPTEGESPGGNREDREDQSLVAGRLLSAERRVHSRASASPNQRLLSWLPIYRRPAGAPTPAEPVHATPVLVVPYAPERGPMRYGMHGPTQHASSARGDRRRGGEHVMGACA